ncbi:hypothetical protein [Maritimibacter sp. DP1N21-5]|uniref:hypothetical protein n=1 Tax=Maritimibacter sp. DP1N21-5 TaxID=2836867 RepID=UPI001C453D4B|nr:hypothetical protein [Maritimibacter sp. DP1N21-5]MBV7408726.1 hypothetical protein [Maritimibacter sp. DP1N21-5]
MPKTIEMIRREGETLADALLRTLRDAEPGDCVVYMRAPAGHVGRPQIFKDAWRFMERGYCLLAQRATAPVSSESGREFEHLAIRMKRWGIPR